MSAVARWPFSLLDRPDWDESWTIKRVGKSNHISDLRIIVYAAVVVALGLILLLVIGPMLLLAINAVLLYFKLGTINVSNFAEIDVVKVVGGILLVVGTIITWAYQMASRRLGVVDLFACEIAILCRVGTVVDFIPNMIAQYNSIGAKPLKATQPEVPQQPLRFNSEEDYFPVFGANAKDLQVLEANVVNNVTAFYTYMKATRDMLRKVSDLGMNAGSAEAERKAIVNVIYMVFLAYESARHAIDHLIEFQPAHAENKIVLLLAEIPAYRFLRKRCAEGEFNDEIHLKRLDLRLAEYQQFIPELCDKVRAHAHIDQWDKANSLVAGLEKELRLLDEETANRASPPAAANAPVAKVA
jgi:hypothetical protein